VEPIIEAAQALAGLLRAADDAGLPAPYSADANNYAPHGHPAKDVAPHFGHVGGISLIVRDHEIAAWAGYLGAETYDGEQYKGNIHRHVDGWSGPVPVQVTALVAVAKAAS
jgi:hypothetical protein